MNALHWFPASFCNSLKGSRANQVSSWKATPGPHEPGLLVHIRIAGRTNSVRWKLTSVTKSSSDHFRGFSGWKHIYWIVFIYHKRCNILLLFYCCRVENNEIKCLGLSGLGLGVELLLVQVPLSKVLLLSLALLVLPPLTYVCTCVQNVLKK